MSASRARFVSSLLPDPRSLRSVRRMRLRLWTGLALALAGSIAVLLLVRNREQEDLHRLADGAARLAGVDPLLAEAVMRAESGGNPRAVSSARAYGLMQLRLATASEVAGRPLAPEDLFDPALNLALGCRYLRTLLDRYGDVRLALMAYNAGPGNVDRWRALSADPDVILRKHAYPETRGYVAKVLATRRVLEEDLSRRGS